jgi:hypothetical protein
MPSTRPRSRATRPARRTPRPGPRSLGNVVTRLARALAVTVGVVAVATLLAGCQPAVIVPPPTRSQVEGTWTHGQTSLDLESDGGFVLTSIPTGVVEQLDVAAGASPKGPDVNVTGSWSIGSGGNDVGGAPGVQLDFADPKTVGPNTGLTLVVSSAAPFHLFVYLGRPDNRNEYQFTKQK